MTRAILITVREDIQELEKLDSLDDLVYYMGADTTPREISKQVDPDRKSRNLKLGFWGVGESNALQYIKGSLHSMVVNRRRSFENGKEKSGQKGREPTAD